MIILISFLLALALLMAMSILWDVRDVSERDVSSPPPATGSRLRRAIYQLLEAIDEEGLDALVDKYQLRARWADDRTVCLNYHQVKTPRDVDMLKACRQLFLRRHMDGTFRLLFTSFYRFFDWDECAEDTDVLRAHVQDALFYDKEDGSLMGLFWDRENNQWQFTTRSTFADVSMCPRLNAATWAQAIQRMTSINFAALNKSYFYIMELCTPDNVNIRSYPTSRAFLLTVLNSETLHELNHGEILAEARIMGLDVPQCHSFDSICDALQYMEARGQREHGWEGFVMVYAGQGGPVRAKLKPQSYLRAERLIKTAPHPAHLLEVMIHGELEAVKQHPRFKHNAHMLLWQLKYEQLCVDMAFIFDEIKECPDGKAVNNTLKRMDSPEMDGLRSLVFRAWKQRASFPHGLHPHSARTVAHT